jgi:pilus assembly protein Flp/PilA
VTQNTEWQIYKNKADRPPNVRRGHVMVKVKRFFAKWFRNEEGASALEYALMAAMVAVAIIAFVPNINKAVTDIFQAIETALTTAASSVSGGGGGG